MGLAGCQPQVLVKGGGDVPKDKPTPDGTPEPQLESRTKFKRNLRLENDMAEALGLSTEQLCNELGINSCARVVHSVALGAPDPYQLGLFEGVDQMGVTAPIAVDRMALSGCSQRVASDFASPGSALIFRNLPVDGTGRLSAPNGSEATAAVTELYHRALQRDPTAAELSMHTDFYAQVESAGSAQPAQDWATLSCFAVLTTLEALFY
jgi:hypothetical protein